MDADLIKQAVKEAMTDAHNEFYVNPQQHYDDHKWTKGTRGNIRTARKGIFYTLGAGFAGFIIWAIQSWITSTMPTP